MDWKYMWELDQTRYPETCIMEYKEEGEIKGDSQFSDSVFKA